MSTDTKYGNTFPWCDVRTDHYVIELEHEPGKMIRFLNIDGDVKDRKRAVAARLRATAEQMCPTEGSAAIKDFLTTVVQFGEATWVSVSDGDRYRAPGNFVDAVRQLLAENEKLRAEVVGYRGQVSTAVGGREHQQAEIECLRGGPNLAKLAEKVVTLTEKNIEWAAEAKYCKMANPDCDPPWSHADESIKVRMRAAVRETAQDLFHGAGMKLEIAPAEKEPS